MDKVKTCLGCVLPICDDRSKECAFVQIARRERTTAERKDTAARVARIYRADPQKKIAQVARWVEANREHRNAYMRKRYALSKQA